ncbi:MAG: Hsp20/alpha crystallin family protein [Gemmatimonas sp.]|jgi:HSP20 family protein|uniref:Hsp20/alpha crystallin family protein n=2 Tax=Gemmatimonas sp. TaxID=1962908 RepID=UPI0022BD9D31|nr:Hsp20/alpha crystallin family protein [Gemmatimonas sp.]MCA2984821.1 Hsp20/alpha crystallin family protein [Gemmatimonas sp.]MCA2994642.1 Hsp20/alpha crystallin family protein [Gemmatimonas sp.]MCE2954516.1 Hsp20/alpha crystallin family protein [Gemmatimonas sp.]MCZ8266948.1 Hsp20/alpha crystallin family protein [Gemmatimonas sp.]
MSTLTRKVPSPRVADDVFSSYLRRMFDDPFTLASNGSWMPAVEVSETNEVMVLTAELPGIEEKALKITIDNNVLTIAGEKEQELTDSPPAKNYYLSERFYGAFQRSFALPRTVDMDHITASFDKGILTVTLPKLPQAKGKVIAVTGR